MHMSMDEKWRCIFIDKMPEALKAPVAWILGIVNMAGRRVGDNDIHTFIPPHLWANFENFIPHLAFSILMRFAVIPMRSLKTHDSQPPESHQFGIQIKTPLRSVPIRATATASPKKEIGNYGPK